MNKKILILLVIIIIVLICFVILNKLFAQDILYQKYRAKHERFFGEETYSEIKYKYSKQEKNVANDILKVADEAFSYIGSKSEMPDKFNALKHYCIDKELYENATKEKHTIKLVTIKIEDNNGYMWVVYSNSAFDDKGDLQCGSGNILTRWTIEKENDKWIVVDWSEAP